MKSCLLAIFALCLSSLPLHGQWVEKSISPGWVAISFDFISEEVAFGAFRDSATNIVHLAKTSDKGTTWTTIPTPSPAYEFMDFDAVNDSLIYFTNRFLSPGSPNPSKMYRSTNAGVTWQDITPDSTGTGYGRSLVSFPSDSVGYWCIADQMYRTRDSGQSWTLTTFPPGYNAIAMDFLTDSMGVVGTWNGTFAYRGGLLSTTDGGNTWRDTAFTYDNSQMASVRVAAPHLWFASTASYDSYAYYTIQLSSDQGKSWSDVNIPIVTASKRLIAFDFRADGNGQLVIADYDTSFVYLTEDSGLSWNFSQAIAEPNLEAIRLSPTSGLLGGGTNRVFSLEKTTAVLPPSASQNFRIFPNPAKNAVMISYEGKLPANVTIYSMEGQMLLTEPIEKELVLPLHTLPPSLYFLVIESEILRESAILMKQ